MTFDQWWEKQEEQPYGLKGSYRVCWDQAQLYGRVYLAGLCIDRATELARLRISLDAMDVERTFAQIRSGEAVSLANQILRSGEE